MVSGSPAVVPASGLRPLDGRLAHIDLRRRTDRVYGMVSS